MFYLSGCFLKFVSAFPLHSLTMLKISLSLVLHHFYQIYFCWRSLASKKTTENDFFVLANRLLDAVLQFHNELSSRWCSLSEHPVVRGLRLLSAWAPCKFIEAHALACAVQEPWWTSSSANSFTIGGVRIEPNFKVCGSYKTRNTFGGNSWES